jgi:hypothetical protein
MWESRRVSRVTRLGVFLPFGRLFTLWIFVKKYWSRAIALSYFLHQKGWGLILKKWVGLHFGRFFNKLIWSPCSWVWGSGIFEANAQESGQSTSCPICLS